MARARDYGSHSRSCGLVNALAIRDDTTVWAWGENAYGQLGDGYLEKVTTLTQVLFDAAVPTGSVTINGGAASTASASVTLVLSASDTGGPIPYVCISNDGVFDTEPWEDYYGSKTWTLSGGDGAKTVCVRYKDFAGNESETTTASIVLDALPPSISSFVVTPALAAEGDAVHVSVDAIDGNGVASVTSPEVALTKTGATTWTGDLTAASGLTAHEISVTASDGYGHTSTQTGSYKTAPVVALANGRPSDQILPLKTAAWLFKVYGRVENLSGSTFDLNTGVGTPVRVTAPGCSGISNGDFVTARGILNSTATPPTLASEGAYIHKHN